MSVNWTFTDNSKQMLSAMDNCTNAALEEIASEIESQAASNTRVATGNTKSKWGHVTENQTAIIGNTEENAIWEEFGTGEYALEGKGRKGGWYVAIGYGKNQMTPETAAKYNFKIIHGKDGVDFAEVHGKKPTRALYKAFTQTKPLIEKTFNTKFKGL